MQVPAKEHLFLRFGSFTVDLASHELRSNGRKINLQEKPYQVLLVLLEHPGKLVTREELRQRLWPADTFVDFEHSINTATKKLREALEDDPEHPRYIETIPRHGYRFLATVVQAEADQRTRLAIVPFQNLGDPEEDYFGNGLTEELIARLGGSCKGIDVVAMTSTSGYAQRKKSPLQICEELQATHLLTGSWLRRNGQCRITTKLLRAVDRCYIWGNSYTCDSESLFSTQDTLAGDIRQSIVSALSGTGEASTALTTRPEVYETYLKARHAASSWSVPGFRTAIQCLERVIEEDPGFAPAYAYLGGLHACLVLWSALPPEVIYRKIDLLTSKALSLSERLEEAHLALGFKYHLRDLDSAAAEKHSRKALDINPSCAQAHNLLAQVAEVHGLHEVAIRHMLRALELDPISPVFNCTLGVVYYQAGKLEEACRQFKYTAELYPQLAIAHGSLAWVHQTRGEFKAAETCARKAVQCDPENAMMQANLAQVLAVVGLKDEARQLLQWLLVWRKNTHVHSYWIAEVYVGLGDIPQALSWLETAFREKCPWRNIVAVDPKLLPLYGEERFRQLLATAGLKPMAVETTEKAPA